MTGKLRYTPQQRQENVSRKQFGDLLEQYEWVTTDVSPDLGEDILVRIYEDGVSTGLSFYAQLKSTDSIDRYKLQSHEISYPFEVKDLVHWEAQALTVVLCIWDVTQRRGWWIPVSSALEHLSETNPDWRQKHNVQVHVPLDHEVNEEGLARLRYFLAGRYLSIVAKDKAMLINARFVFPPTPEGKAKLAEMQRFVAAGDELQIDGEYIETFDLPEWWIRLFGRINLQKMSLEAGPSEPKGYLPVRVEISSELGEIAIPYIELYTIKQGEEEVTLSNEPQRIPVKLEMVLNRVTHQRVVTFSLSLSNQDAEVVWRHVQIQRHLSSGGNIRVILLRSGDVVDTPVPIGAFAPPDPAVVDFTAKVCFIQASLGVELRFPENAAFTAMDVEAAEELVQIIQAGRHQRTDTGYSIELQRPQVMTLLETFGKGDPVHLMVMAPESFVEILATRIDLGPMVRTIKGRWLTSLDEASAWCRHADDSQSMVLRLGAVELTEEFELWPRPGD